MFFTDATLLLFVFVFDFDFLSLLLTARNDGWPCCTRDSRMETVRYIELPTYGLYVMKYADNSHLLFYVYE